MLNENMKYFARWLVLSLIVFLIALFCFECASRAAHADCLACEGFDRDIVTYDGRIDVCWNQLSSASHYDAEAEIYTDGVMGIVTASTGACQVAFGVPVGSVARVRYKPCFGGILDGGDLPDPPSLDCDAWSPYTPWARSAPSLDANRDDIVNGWDFLPFRANWIAGHYGPIDYTSFRESFITGEVVLRREEDIDTQ